MASDNDETEPTSAPEINEQDLAKSESTISQDDSPVEDTPKEEDDEVLKSASDDMSEEEPEKPPKELKKKGSKKKLVVIVLLLLILIAGAAGGWYVFLRDKPASTTEPSVTQTETTNETAQTYLPDTIAYAYRAKDNDPLVVYWRPAAGGERTVAQELTRDSYVTESDVLGTNVAFVTDDAKVYASSDAGKTYKQVFEGEAGDQVTSIKLSGSGNRIAVAVLPDNPKAKNTVKSMDLEGNDSKDLFSSSSQGIFILGWNEDKNQMIYNKGCYACDGSSYDPYIHDLDKDKATQLIKDIERASLWRVEISENLEKIVYAYGTGPTQDQEGIGGSPAAPHTVAVLDIESGKSTEVGEVGKANEKNTNGTAKYRNTLVGFLAGTTNPYFTDEGQLLTAGDEEPTAAYESKNDILSVIYGSDSSLIVTTGDSESDYLLINYTLETEKALTILEGDANARIFGVTTK